MTGGAGYLLSHVFPIAFAYLPQAMDTPEALAMLLAIAQQESRCMHRRQIRGSARGFWQFEAGGGVRGVLQHPATSALAIAAMQAFQYPDSRVETAYAAIEHHDPLACLFARLLLSTVPEPLPVRGDVGGAWQQYLNTWRPGRPHPHTWEAFYVDAWGLVA